MCDYNTAAVRGGAPVLTHLSLAGLHKLSGLQARLQQQLASSPASALQSLELGFAQATEYPPTGADAAAVVSAGRFWQHLLAQMQMLCELRLRGLRACEGGYTPHLWCCIGQLTGAGTVTAAHTMCLTCVRVHTVVAVVCV
jgi:hypothetical protein